MMSLLVVREPLMASSGLISFSSLDGHIDSHFTNGFWQGAGLFASLIWGMSLSLCCCRLTRYRSLLYFRGLSVPRCGVRVVC